MEHHAFKFLLAWIHQHPSDAELITFLIAFSESIALIGLIVPGSVLLMGIGTLVGAHVMPLGTTLLAAISGAILGDGFSFILGYNFSETISRWWPLSKFPTLMARGKTFFEKHGGKSVFIGRFCGPIRPITPLIAGMLRMPPWRFSIATVLSGCGWAPIYMLPGYAIGVASVAIAPKHITEVLLLLLLTVLIVWMVYWIVHITLNKTFELYQACLNFIWQRWRASNTLMYRFFNDPLHETEHGQLNRAVGIVVLGCSFIILALNVKYHGLLTHFNQPVAHFFKSLRNPLMDRIMLCITMLAEPRVTAFAVVAGMSVYFCLTKRFWLLLHWVGLFLLTFVSAYGIKHCVHEMRPLGNTVIRYTASFPSGHVTVATAFYGFLTMLLGRLHSQWKTTLYSVLACFITCIAISRLYLNAHWFNDVVGGLLLGLLCVNIIALSCFHRRTLRFSTTPFLVALLVSVSIGCTAFITRDFKTQLAQYKPLWPLKTVSEKTWWTQATPLPQTLIKTRFGYRIANVNVEWAGNLTAIQHDLIAQGWKTEQANRLNRFLRHFSETHQQDVSPVRSAFYHSRLPTLTLSYKQANKPLLVLRLWRSRWLIHNNMPLWMGQLYYYQASNLDSLVATKRISHLPAETDFVQQLKRYEWKLLKTGDHSLLLVRRHTGHR